MLKRSLTCRLAAALVGILLFVIFTTHILAQQPSIVIKNISVIDGVSGGVQPNRTVVIVGNRTKSIGERGKVAVPIRARVVDGTGKYLIPGLWDPHVHLKSADPLPLFVANGVTGVREMGGDFAVVKDLSDRVNAGKILGPRIKIAGPVLESQRWMKWATDNSKKDNGTGMLEILSKRIAIVDPEQSRETVRKLAEQSVERKVSEEIISLRFV
jgi:hypothetical protein